MPASNKNGKEEQKRNESLTLLHFLYQVESDEYRQPVALDTTMPCQNQSTEIKTTHEE